MSGRSSPLVTKVAASLHAGSRQVREYYRKHHDTRLSPDTAVSGASPLSVSLVKRLAKGVLCMAWT